MSRQASKFIDTSALRTTLLTPLVGTNATMIATTGLAGQPFFNTTYQSWFSWSGSRWWPAGRPEPRYGFHNFDEFMGTDRIGDLDWNTNSGTITFPADTPANHPGVVVLRQSTINDFCNLRSGLAHVLVGAMDIYMEALVNIPILATITDDFCIAFGLNDNATFNANGACTDGVYLTLNRAVNGANWIAHTSSNGTATSSNSSTSVTNGTYYRLGIRITESGTKADFFVNGTSIVSTITTNIPTASGRQTGVQFKLDKTVSLGNSDMYVDYFSMYAFFDTARAT